MKQLYLQTGGPKIVLQKKKTKLIHSVVSPNFFNIPKKKSTKQNFVDFNFIFYYILNLSISTGNIFFCFSFLMKQRNNLEKNYLIFVFVCNIVQFKINLNKILCTNLPTISNSF